ncbi:MFS transporter [Arthrobacter sp. UYEF3]|uniref:MFS transporter n=1 Tax=Arthrobacter sp. UYEF3 TaxID=1756365 RepID=UPI0033979569
MALLVALAHPYGFGTAAFVDGVYTLILACLGPLRSRIVDHLGQRKALLVMGVLSAVALGGVAFLVNVSAPWQLVLALVVIAGLVSPPLSAAVRVSWRQVVNPETDELKVVHSADSVITEVGFILGPTLAGLGFGYLGGAMTYTLAVAASIAGLVIFLAVAWAHTLRIDGEEADAPPPREVTFLTRVAGPLADRRMLVILVPLIGMGFVFGGIGVFTPAYSEHLGIPQTSGIIIAMISVGGVIGGVIYGALPWRLGLWKKYVYLGLGFLIPSCFMAFGTNLWSLMLILPLCGLFVTPLYINAYLLVDSVIPLRMRHEANAWLGSGTDVANGISAIVVGTFISRQDWQGALWAIAGLAVIGILSLGLLRNSEERSVDELQPVA